MLTRLPLASTTASCVAPRVCISAVAAAALVALLSFTDTVSAAVALRHDTIHVMVLGPASSHANTRTALLPLAVGIVWWRGIPSIRSLQTAAQVRWCTA